MFQVPMEHLTYNNPPCGDSPILRQLLTPRPPRFRLFEAWLPPEAKLSTLSDFWRYGRCVGRSTLQRTITYPTIAKGTSSNVDMLVSWRSIPWYRSLFRGMTKAMVSKINIHHMTSQVLHFNGEVADSFERDSLLIVFVTKHLQNHIRH